MGLPWTIEMVTPRFCSSLKALGSDSRSQGRNPADARHPEPQGQYLTYLCDALTYMYDCPAQHALLACKFTGKERDSESGLDNFGARYYASSMGRFMSPDPMGGHLTDPCQSGMALKMIISR